LLMRKLADDKKVTRLSQQ